MHQVTEATHDTMPEWLFSLYDDVFADVILERPAVPEETDFIIRRMDLSPGCRVLDHGCGLGTMSFALAERGMNVMGIDVTKRYVERAQAANTHQAAYPQGGATEFRTEDARHFVTEVAQDGVLSWWTSWGHGATERDNQLMLRRAYQSLRRGGVFLMETLNADYVRSAFNPVLENRREVPLRGGEVLVRRDCALTNQFLETSWSFTLPDGSVTRSDGRMLLLPAKRVAEMLIRAGFGHVELMGDLTGKPLTADSPRLIAVARRLD